MKNQSKLTATATRAAVTCSANTLKKEEKPRFKKLAAKITGETDPTLWLKLEDRFRMTKIQASLGSGKPTQFIVPQLLEDAASGIFNVFVIDRKPPE